VVFLTQGIGVWILLASLSIVLGIVLGVRFGLGAATCRRLLGTIPLIGPLWAWTGAAAFAHLMAVLVDHHVALPDALLLTASGVEDPNVRAACREYAAGVRQGTPLSRLLVDSGRLPQSLVPFVQWGEQNGQLAEAFRTAGEMYMERLRQRAGLLRAISPPVIFILVAVWVLLIIAGLLLPMFNMVQGLA
jgi:type II secretory pathway component PulF